MAESATDQPILHDQYVTDNERRELVKYVINNVYRLLKNMSGIFAHVARISTVCIRR